MPSFKKYLIITLRWSERYTKTDMVYLFHGGFWLGAAQVAASLAAFALTVALANLLSPEVFGEYRFLMSAALIFTAFAMPGMRSAIIESTPKGFRGNLATAFRVMTQWGVIGAIGALATGFYYLYQGNTGLFTGFVIIALLLPWLDSSAIHLEFLKALQDFKRVAIYTLISRVILLAATVMTAFLYPQYAFAIFATFLLGTIIPSMYFHWRTARLYTTPTDVTDPALLTYAKHLSLMAAFSLLAAQIDKVLVWTMIGAEELAIFFIAYAIPQEVVRFLNIVPALAFPKFATADSRVIRRTLLPKLLKYFGAITTVVVAYIILCPIIFSVLFPQYVQAVPYSQILMLSILGSAFLPIGTYFTANKATGVLYFLSIFVPTVRIIATVVGIAFFGLWGAVYATLIAAVLLAGCHLLLFVRKRQ